MKTKTNVSQRSIIFSIVLILNFGFVAVKSFSQSQADWWYFGINAGVHFTGGAPVAVTNGQVNTSEGCASISDAAGNLLFYTDGITVYNKNHTQMPNGFGLFGDPSSTQSAVIIQKPGSSTIYYVFTVAATTGPAGVCYSEIDMTLNGGLGNITANKNILLNTPSCERITGVRHCNNKDVWVVTHDWNSNAFRTYLVTAAGVNALAVVSSAGTVLTGSLLYSVGYLKSSPDGRKLAMAVYDPASRFELFDFNNTTGIVSNSVLFPVYASTAGPYGVEFSPDGTKLYGTIVLPSQVGNIYQFDLCAGSNAAIAASGVVVGSSTDYPEALQLGPDGKIYVALGGPSFLGVINSPNTLGIACNYVNNGVPLAGKQSASGLPNFVPYYFKPPPPPFTVSYNCLSACFTPPTINITKCSSSTNAIDSMLWNFGDPVSGVNDSSTSSNPCHNYPTGGVYTVTLILYYACGNDTITLPITINPLYLTINQSIVICIGSTYTLPDGTIVSTAGIYTDTLTAVTGCDTIINTTLSLAPFLTGSQNQIICVGNTFTLPDGTVVGTAGTYVDTVTSTGGCDSIVTTVLNVIPNSFSTQNQVICTGNTFTLPGGTIVSAQGTYIDTLTAFITGCDSIITTNLTVVVAFTSTQNIILCSGNTFALPDGTIVNVAGTYIDTVITSKGCDSIVTTNLTLKPNSSSNQSAIICFGETYILPDGTIVSASGVYKDTLVSFNGCDSIITSTLTVNPTPTILISLDSTILLGDSYTLTASGGGTYSWSPATGLNTTTGSAVIATPTETTTYCVIVTNSNGCKDTACVTVFVEVPCPANGEVLTLPNAFSPNTDNINEEFCLQGWNFCVDDFIVYIYDRWGEKVFESKDPNFCWDGKYNTKIMDAQVFVYYIKAKYSNIKEDVVKKGNITLIR